ncbi:MAG: single-stranded DNA-binding protein [Oscillospiraceae bacterium]|jgi:single-strand DNA-binding protein|nr:single-stranded DNA-binding protein [Oscillospiraceae bacterium]
MLNIAAFVGRLTSDPELRHTSGGLAMCRFSLAVSRSYVRPGEERQTDFIDVVTWRSTAEFVCNYFRKGQLAAVEGSIQTRTYQGNDGVKRKIFELVANNVHFVESKGSGIRQGVESGESLESGAGAGAGAVYSSGGKEDFNSVELDDDLPF